MNFEPGVPGTVAQHAIKNLNVIQIEGEFKLIKLRDAMLLVWIHWLILKGHSLFLQCKSNIRESVSDNILMFTLN